MLKDKRYLIFLILFPLLMQAQVKDDPFAVPHYDFINFKANKLKFCNDSSDFIKLFEKLDNLVLKGTGNINVIHIGGSHIQADIFSGRIRDRMVTFSPGLQGQRGFVFPYRIAHTNSPRNYWVEYLGEWEACKNVERDRFCDLGLSGIAVTTTDSLTWFMIHKRHNVDYPDYDFNRIKVIHDMENSFEIIPDYDESVSYKTKVDRLLGTTTIELSEYVDTLKIKIVKTDSLQTHFTLHGIILENDDPGVVYNSFGVNGATVPAFNRCSLLKKHLSFYHPDLVILSLGINDAYGKNFDQYGFELNYDTLIRTIKSVAPDAAIILTTNNDSYYRKRYVNKNGEKVKESMFRIAEKHDAAVWDMYTVMGGYNSISIWYRLRLAKYDKIHFTRQGYELLGDLFFNAFLRSYDEYIMNFRQ